MPLQTILGLFSGRSEELVAAHKRHDPGVTLLALSGDGPSLVPTRKAKEVRWRKFVDASGDDPDDPVAKQLQKIRILESRLESSRWLRNWNGTSGLEAESAALLSVRDDVGSAHRDMTEDLARGESKLRESELLLNSTDFSTTRGLEIRPDTA